MRARPFLLWFGVLGAPAAWTVQLVAGYGIEDAACSRGSAHWGLSGDTWQAAVSLVVVAVALAAGGSALAARRERGVDERGRLGFMATIGLLASALFGALIVVTAIGVVSLDSCRPG